MSHEDTKGAHTAGHPIRSIREAREWSVSSQEKPDVSGCRSRQISDTQQVLKNSWRAKELSLDESSGSDPRRPVERSITVLKSPHTTVGIPGSMKSQHNSKNSFLARTWFGAYTQHTRKDSSRIANSPKTSLPSESTQ